MFMEKIIELQINNSKSALKHAINNGNMKGAIRNLKLYWPDADRFLLSISGMLLNVVPDEISGVPLLNACLSNGIHCTASFLKKEVKCPDNLCIIDHFITHTLDPVPRLMCWKFVCDRSKEEWNPLSESMEEWQAKHPFFSILPADRLFTAAEAEIFRQRIRAHLLDQSIEHMLKSGNCTGSCRTPGENGQE